jgi:hypothetical protein
VGVRQGDAPPQREVEYQGRGQPQFEVSLIDQRSTCGTVIGQQIDVLGQGDLVAAVRRRRGATRATPDGPPGGKA